MEKTKISIGLGEALVIILELAKTGSEGAGVGCMDSTFNYIKRVYDREEDEDLIVSFCIDIVAAKRVEQFIRDSFDGELPIAECYHNIEERFNRKKLISEIYDS